MHMRRTIKAALTAATIAVAVALPVGTASAATAGPQVQTVVDEGFYGTYDDCTYEGSTLMFDEGSTGYNCKAKYECLPGSCWIDGYVLYSYFD